MSTNSDPVGHSRPAIEESNGVPLPNALEFPVHDTRVLLRTRMLRGGVILLLSTAFVSATNLLYNIAIARGLGAVGFGHATAIYTSLMLLSAVTLAFQLVCSKFVARNTDPSSQLAVYRSLLKRAWQIGLALGAAMAAASGPISQYLNLPNHHDIVLLGVGTAIYIPLGARRGLLQGLCDFRRLALNFVLEVLVKFGGALLLLHYGLGVTGVIAAVVGSIAVAYDAAAPRTSANPARVPAIPASFREGMQAIVFFVGQVIIGNMDILLVKHYFPADVAGLYAAVALVGRVVYMFSWSVVSSMFPVSAASSQRSASRDVMKSALGLVAGITSAFTLAAWLAPTSLWKMILGASFLGNSGHAPFSSWLGSYSAMTSIYSIAVVLLTYEMSRRIANATWIQLLFSALLPLAIMAFHDSVQQVIAVQVVLMLGLLLAVTVPFWLEILSGHDESDGLTWGRFTKIRKVTEQEVVAEFLKAEFYQPEFDPYREAVAAVVFNGDIRDEGQNAIRKALLYRRRGRLWRELPDNTTWWEIELQPSDLVRIRAFPRKQWRRFADGDFHLVTMIDRIRSHVESSDRSWFSKKMRSVAADLQANSISNSVLLIGVDEGGPLTIIEGNHRMAAAMLNSSGTVTRRFRFYCGLSPDMTTCCWYRTDLGSLSRYAHNTIRYLLRDRDYVVQRILRDEMHESGAR